MRSAPGPGPMRKDNFGLCSNKPIGQSPGVLESGGICQADQIMIRTTFPIISLIILGSFNIEAGRFLLNAGC